MIEKRQQKRQRGIPHPENLIPIKPGERRNPNGYSKERREKDAFRAMAAEIWATAPQDIMNAIKEGVSRRRFDFVKEATERFYGKVPQKVNLGDADGEPLQLTLTVLSPESKKRVDDLRNKLTGEK